MFQPEEWASVPTDMGADGGPGSSLHDGDEVMFINRRALACSLVHFTRRDKGTHTGGRRDGRITVQTGSFLTSTVTTSLLNLRPYYKHKHS